MSNTDLKDVDHGDTLPPTETIDQRIERGQATDRAHDGAIAPFPAKYSVTGNLRGGMARSHEEAIRGGYRLTEYRYKSAAGDAIQVVLRYDHQDHPHTNEKIIRPILYYGRLENESSLGSAWIKKPRPLYGLDRLASRPEAPVLVVEGEKTAEAAAILFPDHVVITWMSGAQNVRNTEMFVLKGWDLTLWPDNDQPGRAAMRTFAAYAYDAGAASVKMVDVPSEFGAKWDLADVVPPAVAEPLEELLVTARVVDRSQVGHLASDARQAAEQRRLLGYEPGYTDVQLTAAETALSVLDADMYRNEWLQIARCLYYAYSDRALVMFDDWSRRSPKYREGEPGKLWASFAGEVAFRAKPLAWLFRKAVAVLAGRKVDDASNSPNVEIDDEAIVLASIEELNEDHAVVVRGGKLGVLWEAYDPRFKRYTEIYLSKRDFVDRHVRSIALNFDHERQNQKHNKRISQGELWFGSARRKAYEGVHFAPKEPLGPTFLNLWRGFAVEPTNNPEGWSRLKEHLKTHVAAGDQASYEYLLNWLAFAVQHLDRPVGVALVLIGKKGAGKSIITELFGRLFGQHTFVTSRMDDVTGQFNARLETTALLGLEEAVAAPNRAVDGTLKDLVTRPTLRLEGKFFGVWDAPNHLRIIATSNNEHVVRADGSERRYAVFDVDNPHQSDPVKRRAYFGLMVEQMETGGYGAMLGELQSRDIRGWNPEVIPETAALKRQKVLNLVNDPVRRYLYDRLTEGEYIIVPSARSSIAAARWSATEEVMVPARDLIEDFRDYAAAHGMRFSEGQLPIQLKKYMPAGWRSVTKRRGVGENASDALEVPGSTFRAYPFPPLEQARTLFEEVTGISIDRGA